MYVNAETFFPISAALLEKGVGYRARRHGVLGVVP